MKYLGAQAAYGREAKREDWEAGKDFKIVGGPYFSIRDVAQLKAAGYVRVIVYGTRFAGPAFTVDLSQ